MKKIICLIFIFTIIFNSSIAIVSAEANNSARAAVVMDVRTGRVLYSKNPDIKLPMASTTKIMTVLVAIESGRLKEKVTVSKRAAYTDGSSIYLRENEKITVEELLYGIMLRSGNDAATAVAEHIGGSVEGFAAMMNEKARKIGALNTSFANPHGLDNPAHYTTAYDLALITSYALKNPKFAEIVSTKHKTISGPPDVNWNRSMMNKNKMLWEYQGGDGVKTGYTKRAGRCLVSSATRNNWQLCSVVLNDGPMWEDSKSLLDYCFNNYSQQKVVDSTEIYQRLKVVGGQKDIIGLKPVKDLYLPLSKDEENRVIFIPSLKFNNRAPIYKGANAGELKIYIGDKLAGTVDLVYTESIRSQNPLYYMQKIFRNVLD
jgi:D-alanyl-D-alanine carboxypeptidase (penicillin-binding protein 5/6)